MGDFYLSPKQVRGFRILDSPATRILFDGGARSGKTDCIIYYLLLHLRDTPGIRILCARKFRDHAKNTTAESIRKMADVCQGLTYRESDMEFHAPNGGVLRVAGLDDQERVDKILGDEYGIIFVNESTQISWPTLQIVMTRLSQMVPGLPERKLILDCNPKSQRHWLYRAGVLHRNPETGDLLPDADSWARLHWTPYDNPHLPPDYIRTLESMTGTQRRRMLAGEWCESEGAVYDEFDEDVHVLQSMPSGWERWRKVRGIDFGYTNPFVCLWAALDGDGRLYVYREHYKRQMTCRDHAAHLHAVAKANKENYLWTVADPEAAEDRATLAQAGLPTLPAYKDIASGIARVKERLRVQGDGKPRLYVLASCAETIGEMYDYAWAPSKEGRSDKEVPTKDRDHAMDTLRYIVAQLDSPRGGNMAVV